MPTGGPILSQREESNCMISFVLLLHYTVGAE
jgi:hypothetical protein